MEKEFQTKMIELIKNKESFTLSVDDKISDLLKIINENSSENLNKDFIFKISLKNSLQIKILPKENFISGKEDSEELIHPFFNDKKIKSDFHSNKNYNKLDIVKEDKIILFSPHPDDEILGASALIHKCFNNSIDLKIVYMTSGKGAGNVDVRKTEAINGIKKLGGNQENLIFSNAPFYSKKDREISEDDVNYFKEIIEKFKPNKIFISADIFDPNRTHKKCFDILMKIYDSEIFQNLKFYFYYSVWYWPKDHEFTHFLDYNFELYKLKIFSMLEHRSQYENEFMGGDSTPFYQRACNRDSYFGRKMNFKFCEVYYSLN